MCWGDWEPEGSWGDHGREWPPEGERFMAISTGSSHTCGLWQEDSTAVCWRENLNESAFPPREEALAQVASGSGHTCGLRWDGSVECWGWLRSTSGGYIVPQSEHYETFATIESGTYHVCALREDGSPVCWGDNGSGEATPPEGEKFAAISAGYEHTCALRQDGSPVCWGDPIARYAFGQASPPEGERLITISSGAYHTCALRQGGAPVCWGPSLATKVRSSAGQVSANRTPRRASSSSPSAAADCTVALFAPMVPPSAGVRGFQPRNPRAHRPPPLRKTAQAPR